MDDNSRPAEFADDESGVRGPFVIGGIVLLALMAAGAAWLYSWSIQSRAVNYWGGDNARSIMQSPHVDALRLVPSNEQSDRASDAGLVTIGGTPWRIAATTDVSKQLGLSYVRQSLLNGASFDWDATRDCRPNWQYALRFEDEDGERQTIIAFDFDCKLVTQSQSDSPAPLENAVAPLMDFMVAVFPSSTGAGE